MQERAVTAPGSPEIYEEHDALTDPGLLASPYGADGLAEPRNFGHGDARGWWFLRVDLHRDLLALANRQISPWRWLARRGRAQQARRRCRHPRLRSSGSGDRSGRRCGRRFCRASSDGGGLPNSALVISDKREAVDNVCHGLMARVMTMSFLPAASRRRRCPSTAVPLRVRGRGISAAFPAT